VSSPIRLIFGLHLHQPVGNFDHVFANHVRDVYRPFLDRVQGADFFPLTLHVSGPLLEWLDTHESGLLDTIGRLVADQRVELLASGFDEPILASLPRDDRLEQIARMRSYLASRFGANAVGLWLTERVWQPDLAADLADAGVTYTFVDDRHFLVSGFRHDQLHRPWYTESNGRRLALLAIDERLRYLIPFRPPPETAEYLRQLRAAGHGLAVLADDGEKMGGWPGTKEWVYDRGWLDQFFGVMYELIRGGEVQLVRAIDAVAAVPSGGIAYLGTASYREMEQWSLPASAQHEFERLERAHPDSAFVRGGHWSNFLVKYPEANRLHKTMVAVSGLARQRGDPPIARRAIGRAQCNDAYWHGVFGGLYLPHLRSAVWHQLAIAEGELRRGESCGYETVDIDRDGRDELWVHSADFSAIVAPHRGGAVETLLRFAEGTNLADTITRRREAYHEAASAADAGHQTEAGGTPSIHDLERAQRAPALPPADLNTRSLVVERVLPGGMSEAEYIAAAYTPLRSWAVEPMEAAVQVTDGEIVIALEGGSLSKTIRFTASGCVRVEYRWETRGFPGDAVFAPEISVAREVPVTLDPANAIWSYPIATVARSERGFDGTIQGTSYTPRWPIELEQAVLEIRL
jgi:hypothetical protein